MKIQIRDSKQLQDSINFYRKKIMDAQPVEHPDLTKPGIKSIANDLLAEKERIDAAQGFAELAKIMKETISKTDSPKARELLFKIADLEKLYARKPEKGSHNDFWLWEKLLRFCYNIILRASNNPSPDVKQKKEDSVCDEDQQELEFEIEEIEAALVELDLKSVSGLTMEEEKRQEELEKRLNELKGKLKKQTKDEDPNDTVDRTLNKVHGVDLIKDDEDPVLHLCQLLGEAHDKIIEALDVAEALENDDEVASSLRYAIEDLEASASELDFMGEDDPKAKLFEEHPTEDGYDSDDDFDFGEED